MDDDRRARAAFPVVVESTADSKNVHRLNEQEAGRWLGRPVLSAGVVVAAHLIPISAAIATSALLSRQFHRPDGLAETAGQWGLLFAASTAVLLLVDRAAKRLLPLAALLKLSMLFPDRAPKRLSVARRSGSVRKLEARLAEARALGADDEPTRAAEVILSLVGALHAHDRHTRGHSERVRWFTDLLAEEMKLPEADRDRLRWAALLHDIGKLEVHQRILNKPGGLDSSEWKHIHRHPEAGAAIVAPLSSWLGEWSLTVLQHHERFDGKGYPRQLRGDEISLGARIVAVADAFEVMTAVRSYKRAATASAARRELTASAGAHFDPAVVRAFLNVSIGKLRWVSGPVAWLAQIPFVGWLPRLAEGAAAVGGQAAGVAGTAAGAAVLSSTSPFVVPVEPAGTPVAVVSEPASDRGSSSGVDAGARVDPVKEKANGAADPATTPGPDHPTGQDRAGAAASPEEKVPPGQAETDHGAAARQVDEPVTTTARPKTNAKPAEATVTTIAQATKVGVEKSG
jgi:putative nucleotidyltransferase with HDIG domain